MSILFDPIKIGNLELKNRFVRSATQDWWGNPDGTISPEEMDLYQKLAQNQVGLIIAAHSYIDHPRGRASLKQNGIYDDKFIPGYQKLAELVHNYGSKLLVQISHAGSQTNKEFTEGVEPLNLNLISQEEIERLIAEFVQAIARVKKAGCDGVQIHMAHGYLLSRFLSPQSNKRQDKWGGNIDNRINIVKKIITRAKALVGDDFPILVKLNSTGGFDGTAAIPIEDVIYIAQQLEKLGVAAIEISGGAVGEKRNSLSRTGILKAEQEGYFKENAQAVKRAVNIPIILVGGLRSKTVMESIIQAGSADLVSLSRPFIKEPDLVVKLKNGQEKVSCISCNQCRDFQGIRCALTEK